MTSPAIKLARECGAQMLDRYGLVLAFETVSIERFYAKAQAQALRDAADEILRMADYDPAAGALQAMADELEAGK